MDNLNSLDNKEQQLKVFLADIAPKNITKDIL